MSLSEPVVPPARAAASTLQIRRPGHAVMTHLLRQLDARGASRVPPDLMSWYDGAVGEVLVGQELARLPEGWRVLHAVPAGTSADIDHLVIGPSGVHVLNTKRHPDKKVVVGTHQVWINGTGVPYQRDLLRRTEEVRELLRPVLGAADVVRPLLVFVDTARCTTSGEQPVPSIAIEQLVEFLVSQERRLASGAIGAVHAKAAEPTTWGRERTVLDEPDPSARFHALIADRTVHRGSAPIVHRRAVGAGGPPPARVNRSRRSRRGLTSVLVRLGLLIGFVVSAPTIVPAVASWLAQVLTALLAR